MNKILTVGHPHSGYRDVEKMLFSCGMQPAKISKHEGLDPVEIDTILRQAHNYVPIEKLTTKQSGMQIAAGPVWNGLALDLLMNNLNQDFWGWSDPQAIYLLDYWKSLDPKMAFVLVYDEPHQVLAEMVCGEAKLCTRETIEQRLDNWHAYNISLLGFYLRNHDRGLLVNARQVRKTGDAYLKELRAYLDDHLLPSDCTKHDEAFTVLPSRSSIDGTLQQTATVFSDKALTLPALADRFLIESILSGYPQYLQCYEELQAVATLPFLGETSATPEPIEAWLAHMRRRAESVRIMTNLAEAKQRFGMELIELEKQTTGLRAELAGSERANNELAEEKEKFVAKLDEQKSKLEQTQEELVRNGSKSKELTEENELLLAQLHQAQEELERYYLENQKNKNGEEEKVLLEKKHVELIKEKKKLDAKLAEQQQQIEEVRKELTRNSTTRKELAEENELLLAQLHKAQEELERYYLDNKRGSSNFNPVLYGAADRLKSELPYQLGAAIIELSRKVWPLPFLPILLGRIVRKYWQENKKKPLPPLIAYRDYHEAEKAMNHLSYRLGEVWLQKCRTPWGWVVMPFALIGAHRSYRQYCKSLEKQER